MKLQSAPSRHSPPRASKPGRQAANTWQPLTLIVLVSVWLASVGNIALWRELGSYSELQNLRGLGFGLAFGLMIAAALSALSALFAWRWTLKPLLTVLLVSAAAGGYFMSAYRIVIDTTMMVNVLQTDVRETRDLLNWELAIHLLMVAGLPAWALWRARVRQTRTLLRQLALNAATFVGSLVILLLALFLIFRDFSSVMRNHTHARYLINPLNSVYALVDLALKPLERNDSIVLPLGEDATLGVRYATQPRPPMLVLVLGETARADNFSLNGYARPTTPELDARHDLANWHNAWSCGTNTAASVPCMFSHLSKEAFEARKVNHEGLLDVLHRAGLAVLWVENQSGCKDACDRIPNVNTGHLKDPNWCSTDECFDEIMLQGLEERIAALPAERRARGVVVVLHQMGSHGPAYYKRSPPAYKAFTPECTRNALQECSREDVVNAYDNTIRYTDHFINATIGWLEARQKSHDTALMYVSDHGESLGENNLYLHGLPYAVSPDVQRHVPWIAWLSPAMQSVSGIRTECLRQHTHERITHDHYFHSVLGQMAVHTGVYRPELDIFAPCAQR